MKTVLFAIAVLCLWAGLPAARGIAGVKSSAARELAEYVIEKVGIKGGEEAATELTVRIEAAAAKYGEAETVAAVRTVGRPAIRLAEDAGENGPKAMKLMAQFGEDGARIVSRPAEMATFLKYGEPAAEAMVRHENIVVPVIDAFGEPAVNALVKVGPRNGRRVAMMVEDGELTIAGRGAELLGTVAKYGDPAMDFIWKHKGSLAVATALTAFLADPEPFISGAKDITQIAAENVAKPLAEAPGTIATEAAKRTNWTLALIVVVVVAGGLRFVRLKWKREQSGAA